MTIEIRQITSVFAGEVSGVDITQPLSRDEVAAIEAGMDRYAVLVFRDQPLTDDAQRAFTRNFGNLEVITRRAHRDSGGTSTAAGHAGRVEPRQGR